MQENRNIPENTARIAVLDPWIFWKFIVNEQDTSLMKTVKCLHCSKFDQIHRMPIRERSGSEGFLRSFWKEKYWKQRESNQRNRTKFSKQSTIIRRTPTRNKVLSEEEQKEAKLNYVSDIKEEIHMHKNNEDKNK